MEIKRKKAADEAAAAPEAAEAPKVNTPAPEGAEDAPQDDWRGTYSAAHKSWIKRN